MSKALTVAPVINSLIWVAYHKESWFGTMSNVRLVVYKDTDSYRAALKEGIMFTTLEDAVEKLKELRGGSLQLDHDEHAVIIEVSPNCNRPVGIAVWKFKGDEQDNERIEANRAFSSIKKAVKFLKEFRAECVSTNKSVQCLIPSENIFEAVPCTQFIRNNELDSISIMHIDAVAAYHTLTVFSSAEDAELFQRELAINFADSDN